MPTEYHQKLYRHQALGRHLCTSCCRLKMSSWPAIWLTAVTVSWPNGIILTTVVMVG